MPERANVISLFRRRPPAWEAAPDQTTITEPALALTDQLQAAPAVPAAPPTSVLTGPPPPAGVEALGQPGASRHRLRLARELLYPVTASTTTPGATRASHSDRPGGPDVDS